MEVLAEVGAHLADPLCDKARRRYNQDALGKPSDLEFAEDEPSLNGLAKSHLIGQQVADPVARNRPRKSSDLVG